MLFSLRSFLRPLLGTTKSNTPSLSPSDLAALPAELFAEVLKLLDWHDVLRTRQVCRRLNRASHERSVWLNIFLRYSKVLPHLFRLEKPLARYSSAELEALTLRWKAVDKRWSIDGACLNLGRTFNVKDKTRDSSHLVRGGRWFLAGTIHGEIQYFDLDAAVITPNTLIPAPFQHTFARNPRTNVQMRISVDLNYDSPGLAFNLAVCMARNDRGRDEPRYLQVWHVKAESDDSGHVFGLSAKKLVSFFEEGDMDIYQVSLFQEHLAYSIRHSRPKQIRQDVVIVKWAECDGDDLSYRRRVIPRQIVDWISLIPGNRILCGDHQTKLFEFHNIQETTKIPSGLPSASPVTQCLMDLYSHAISEPFFTEDSTRVLFATSESINGLIVYHGLPARMEVREFIGGAINASDVQLGYNSVLSFLDGQVFTSRAYWDGQAGNHFISPKGFELPTTNLCGFVDDVSGRILITTLHGNQHTLAEISVAT